MRSGWMRLVRTAAVMLALAGGLWGSGAGAAEIRNVTAKYTWPWGVCINYEVLGSIISFEPIIVTALDRTDGTTYTATASALSGDTGTKEGWHQLLWDFDKQGINIQSTSVVFTVNYPWPRYCVVDLSDGAKASSYPVTYHSYLYDIPKTNLLALRRIDAGTFMMGESTQTTLSDPYYMGVVEVTQKQFELVTGT